MKKWLSLLLLIIPLIVCAQGQQASLSNPLGGDVIATSSNCSVVLSCVWQKLPAPTTTVTVTVSGTFVATLQFEQSGDGVNFVSASPASTTTTGTTTFTVTSMTDFRVRASAYTSGKASVNIQASGNQTNITINTSGGSVPANSPLPAATSGPGPVFNVKNYGAKGDTQISLSGGTANSTTTFTCSDCAFTQADVGKTISAGLAQPTGNGSYVANTTTISSVTNGTTVILSSTALGTSAGLTVVWGTLDNTAIDTAFAAVLAAAATNLVSNPPTLYFPAGRYSYTHEMKVDFTPNAKSGVLLLGDGSAASTIQILNGSTVTDAFIFDTASNNLKIQGLGFDGGNGQHTATAQAAALALDGLQVVLNDVSVGRFNIQGILTQSTNTNFYTVVTNNNNGGGIECSSCAGEWRYLTSSNNGNGVNLYLLNVIGLNANEGLKIYGGLIDECGTSAVCSQAQNSNDVWFIGTSMFGTAGGYAFAAFSNSFIHMSGGIAGAFGTDNNVKGAEALDRSVIQASDTRFVSTGTGNCLNVVGGLNDNGGNTCESMFRIASGTSTGTTAVLTLTNAGAAVNTNCSVGDALLVEGALISGYNGYYPAGTVTGITATSATTLTYTTTGSNLGALSAGGVAFCRNLQTFTGSLPKALLNNPVPNTCYVTGTFGATVTGAPMCAFKTQSATNVTNIKAASTTVTACTVAPVVTISDGTVSVTLTLTTAKSLWDSSVDASTGVGATIFKPNGTIQVTNTVGTCTTPPTNFSVSYNISPILSN